MADSDGQDKTEQPTGKKLDDSRSEGQAAKSQELNSLAIFSTGLIVVYIYKEKLGDSMAEVAKDIFSSAAQLNITANLVSFFAVKALGFFLVTLSPIFVALVIISLVVGYGQVGFKITPKAMAPKFSKMNPIKGIKNKFFSSEPFVEVLKSLIKIIIIGWFTYLVLEDSIADAIGLVNYSIGNVVNFMIDTSFDLLWKISLVFAVIAAADFTYQKYKHKKGLMMTKQEVKEEFKQQEGDPLIKGQIKGKQLAMARSRMMQEVPKADVVITNPTHFAVALKYSIGKDSAPRVIAKGADRVAQKIKEIALENKIPLHEDVSLARALFKACEVGDEIPDKLFKAVAQVLAYIYQLKNRKKKKSIV
ncbi:MAG: flagellar biosynthesis protein FlhB [Bacteroidetes bacterium]|nr:flagellar biosynthesis protein FlhB [Bacteroidota bacterium]